MSGLEYGTVKWYNPEKAYGFITTGEGQDLFVHRKAIADGRSWLVDGQEVEFSLRQGLKGPEAADVRVIQDVAELPAGRRRMYEQAEQYASARGAAHSRSREPFSGPLPAGPVEAEVLRVDPSRRFLFARSESVGDDIYVHGSLFSRQDLQRGDTILVVVEQSDRGLRARTLLSD
jgi:CspA family cold shock protein